MFILAWNSDYLYNAFCRVTGYAGTTNKGEAATGEVLDRQITIKFNADTADDLPWEFKEDQKEVLVNVGENSLAFFSAENKSVKATAGTSIYNVTPQKVGKYFTKVECFCFERQELKPYEEIKFPVSFYIDPAIIEDSDMDDVREITLSYVFYVDKEE